MRFQSFGSIILKCIMRFRSARLKCWKRYELDDSFVGYICWSFQHRHEHTIWNIESCDIHIHWLTIQTRVVHFVVICLYFELDCTVAVSDVFFVVSTLVAERPFLRQLWFCSLQHFIRVVNVPQVVIVDWSNWRFNPSLLLVWINLATYHELYTLSFSGDITSWLDNIVATSFLPTSATWNRVQT